MDEEGGPASFRAGAEVLRAALDDMSSGPGVYRMLDAAGDAL
jgi:excinuclease UvrABC nuclease subunit